MKFLCVPCDEPMKLRDTRGPDNGSMTLIFGCPSCGYEAAMLTNTMETQMVRSLGVKIGGRTVPAEPMEMVRGSLAEPAEVAEAAEPHPAAEPTNGTGSGSKCPFTGMVNEAFEQQKQATGPTWTPEAEARLARIPSFVQPMVRKSIEQHARERGYAAIDLTVMNEVKGHMGM